MNASSILDNLYIEKVARTITGYQVRNNLHGEPMTFDEAWDRRSAGARARFDRRIQIRQRQASQQAPQQAPQQASQQASQQAPQPQPQQNNQSWVDHEKAMYTRALEDQTGVPVFKPSGEKPNYEQMVNAGSIEKTTKKRTQSNQNIQDQLDNQQPKTQPKTVANPESNLNKLRFSGTNWIKNNPGKAAIGATAIAGAAAAAYGIHKHNQKKKEEQRQSQYSQYDQSMYRTASSYLDEMVLEKQASTEVEDVAVQIPEQIIPDEASMMERIVESVKHTKPQRTPGGKVTPSKFVQRKNKERFKA